MSSWLFIASDSERLQEWHEKFSATREIIIYKGAALILPAMASHTLTAHSCHSFHDFHHTSRSVAKDFLVEIIRLSKQAIKQRKLYDSNVLNYICNT